MENVGTSRKKLGRVAVASLIGKLDREAVTGVDKGRLMSR